MSSVTVENLAKIIGSDEEALLSQMKEAGLSHTDVKDEVTDNDKKILKGDPIYLKDNDGMTTTPSSIELRSNGELVLPEKINLNSLN